VHTLPDLICIKGIDQPLAGNVGLVASIDCYALMLVGESICVGK
jgi:hypothetical protein